MGPGDTAGVGGGLQPTQLLRSWGPGDPSPSRHCPPPAPDTSRSCVLMSLFSSGSFLGHSFPTQRCQYTPAQSPGPVSLPTLPPTPLPLPISPNLASSHETSDARPQIGGTSKLPGARVLQPHLFLPVLVGTRLSGLGSWRLVPSALHQLLSRGFSDPPPQPLYLQLPSPQLLSMTGPSGVLNGYALGVVFQWLVVFMLSLPIMLSRASGHISLADKPRVSGAWRAV